MLPVAALALALTAQDAPLMIDWVKSPIDGNWYGVELQPGSWTASAARAAAFGLTLAEPDSAALDDWLDGTFSEYFSSAFPSSTHLWIGLFQDPQDPNYSEPAGGWRWASGNPISFVDWFPGQPDNSPDEDYATISPGTTSVASVADLPDNAADWGHTVRPLLRRDTPPMGGLSWPKSVALGGQVTEFDWSDFNSDGLLDLVWFDKSTNTLKLALANSVGELTIHSEYTYPSGLLNQIKAANLDGDPWHEVVVSSRDFDVLQIIDLEVPGSTGPIWEASGRNYDAIWVEDLDGVSGNEIVASANDYNVPSLGQGLFLFTGSGSTWTEQQLDSSDVVNGCFSIDCVDVDGDGAKDLVAAEYAGQEVSIFSNPVAAGAPWNRLPVVLSSNPGQHFTCRAGDMNGDGAVDLVTTNPNSQSATVWIQSGSLQFTNTASVSVGGQCDETVVHDFDGDGDLDFAISRYNPGNSLYFYSNSGDGSSFAETVVAGTTTDPVGGQVTLTFDSALDRTFLSTVGRSDVNPGPNLTCWTIFELDPDCDDDGITDEDEISAGAPDCNGNGIPDECDVTSGLDCDGNGNPDACDIATDLSIDCNGNGVIDTCELNADPSLDCNGNGIPDSCDIASGFALDCNNNGIPDDCDLANDPSLDANLNNVPDICEGPGRTWILSPVTGNWYATTDELTADAAEQQAQNWGGHLVAISDPTENDWVAATFGDATNPVWIGLTDFEVEGSFVWWNGEDYTWSNWAANEPDNGGIIGSDFTLLHPATGEWTDEPRTVLARGVVELVAGDCDGNGIPDAYEALGDPSLDCDGNGTFDTCDLADPANDCDGDGLLDACEIDADPSLDCDGNGQLDACEILADWSLDCDLDDVLDACQIAADPSLDCDLDGVLDSCQIALDAALDCDGDGVLDTCQLEDPANDWDGSGVLDACEGGAPVYCVGNLNATGTNGKLEAQGSPLIADNAFTLHSWDLPTGVPAYFVFSRLTGDINPFGGGLGRLCLGPPIRRFNPANGYGILFTSGTGEVLFTPDLGNLPQTPIAPGETLHFQLWHREFDANTGSQTSNTSDAIGVMFR